MFASLTMAIASILPLAVAQRPFRGQQNFDIVESRFTAKHAVLVHASVNGTKSGWFMVDTGSTLTHIDENFARELGLRVVEDQAYKGGRCVSDVRLDLAPRSSLSLKKVAVLGVRQYGFIQGVPVDGLLGLDLLRQMVMRIDYDQQIVGLVLVDPTMPVLLETPDLVDLPIRSDRGEFVRMSTRVHVGDVAAEIALIVDSAADTNISLFRDTPVVSLLNACREDPARSLQIIWNRKRYFQEGWCDVPIDVAGLWTATQTIVETTERHIFAHKSDSGIVGAAFLAYHSPIVINWRNKEIRVSRNESKDQRPFVGGRMRGMSIIPLSDYPNEAYVQQVVPGSSAQQAGILAGDRIIAVNGCPGDDQITYWMPWFFDMFSNEAIQVKAVRGEQELLILVPPAPHCFE